MRVRVTKGRPSARNSVTSRGIEWDFNINTDFGIICCKMMWYLLDMLYSMVS